MFDLSIIFNRRFYFSEKKLLNMGFLKTHDKYGNTIYRFTLKRLVFIANYSEQLWYFGQTTVSLSTYLGQEITDENIKYIKAVIKTSTNSINHVF